MRVLGIDEAGRGCVLGSLIVGAFLMDPLDDAALLAAGAADSKAISHKRRVAARAPLSALGTADVIAITAAEIDAGNLNALEEAAIVTLCRRHQPDRVIIDALGHPRTLPALIERLRAQLGANAPLFVVQPKADRDFPIVGAASIFAKTHRDAQLAEADATHGPLGSGYPSDPVTRAWITGWAQRGAPWPPFVRTRWQTITDLAQLALSPQP